MNNGKDMWMSSMLSYGLPIVYFVFSLGIYTILLSRNGHADVYQPKIKLGPFVGDLKIGPGMVATGHRLWGSEIVGQDLRNACFDDCDLGNVVFRQCNLQGATFRRSVMTGLVIDDCDWGSNDFTDSVINGIHMGPDYAWTDWIPFSEDQLKVTWSYKHKVLDGCKLRFDDSQPPSFDFTGFSLRRITFRWTDLSRCRFENSVIVESQFAYCDFSNCRFNGARIADVRFENCKINLSQLRQAKVFWPASCEFKKVRVTGGQFDFSGRHLPRCLSGEFDNVIVSDSTINGAYLGKWLRRNALESTRSYKIGNLSNIHLTSVNLSNADLSGQLIAGAGFRLCDLTGCRFDDAVISDVSFTKCKGLTVGQIRSTWNYKNGRMEGITLPSDITHAIDKSKR